MLSRFFSRPRIRKRQLDFFGGVGGGVMGDFNKIYPAHRKKNLSWSTNLEIKILHRCMSRKKFFHQRFGKKFLPKPNHAYPPSTVELMVISLTIFARPDTNTTKTWIDDFLANYFHVTWNLTITLFSVVSLWAGNIWRSLKCLKGVKE